MNLNLSIKTIRTIIDADFIDSNQLFQETNIQNVIIDSRSPLINKRTLFIILKGNKASGADYIPEFAEKGGVLVLTDKVLPNQNIAQLVVNDPLKALQKIAAFHRKKFDIPVIGITGSNGKTTVKEWLYHVLKGKYAIVRSPKSYNSQIGVALSVLEMKEGHDLAIFEAGISKPYEMEHLEMMIQPTIGIFTGIGDAHNSGFSSENPEEEKRKEKYKLFQSVTALIERKADFIAVQSSDKTTRYLFGTTETCFKLQHDDKIDKIKTPFSDKASLSNAALVYLTARLFNLSDSDLCNEIGTLPSISMRLEKMNGKSGNILINDVYNLDEKSLEIGLKYLDWNREGKETAIFIAEDPLKVSASSTLLNALQNIKAQIHVNRVVYFGSKTLSQKFDFVDQQYDTVQDFASNPFEVENNAILFTGARTCHLETIVNYYTNKKHITRLLVNLESVRKNLNIFRNKLKGDTAILAMVKAQSYGGGMLEVARFLEKENVSYFGVAYADEGVALRNGGITKPILVMNPEPAAFDDIIDFGLEPSIYSLKLLNAFIHQLILRQKSNFPVHIKLDTGMNRLGFREDEFKELLEMITVQPEVYVHSVFSHLSVADDDDESGYTKNQIATFQKQTDLIEKSLGYSFISHLANSAGAYHYPNAHFDMVRLGIGLYGLLTENQESGFENVLQLSSQISQTRSIKAGESVGYGRAFIAQKDTTIGIVPVGYGDGLRRGLGNGNWAVVIRDKKYPIIGSICMDMCMVNLGQDAIEVGAEVQLFGDGNSVFEMSRILETIPYEIISGVSARVHRVYLEE